MFRNYLVTALRNIFRHRLYSLINIAGLAVGLVLAAERAVLAHLKPVGVVAPVLARDVVAVFALLASQSDLWPDVGRSHGRRALLSRLNIGAALRGDPAGARL